METKELPTLTVVRDLAVTPSRFYNHLLDDMLFIKNKNASKDKMLKREDLVKGMIITNGESDKYKRVEYIIDDIKKDKVFQVSVRSFAHKGWTRYELKKSEKGVKVTQTQTIAESILDYKNVFLRKFGEMTTLSKMSKGLMDYEREQIMRREKTPEPPTFLDITKAIYRIFTKKKGYKDVIEDYKKRNTFD